MGGYNRASKAALIGVAALAALAGLPSLAYVFGRDQAIFAYAGWRWLHGGLPYLATWDNKPPAIYALYALTLRLFGHNMWGVRVVDLLAVIATAALLFHLGRRWFGPTAGFFAGALYGLSYFFAFDYWNTAQCEGFISLFLVLGIVLIRPTAPARPMRLAAGAAACGIAFVFKCTASLVFALVALAAAWQVWRGARRARPIAWLAFGFALPAAAAVLYFRAHGALREMLSLVFGFNLSYIAGSALPSTTLRESRSSVGYAALMLGTAVPLAAWGAAFSLAAARTRAGLLAVAWLAVSVAMVLVGGRLFWYHWQVVLAPLCVLGGRGAALLVAFARRSPWPAVRPWVWRIAAAGALAHFVGFTWATLPATYALSAGHLLGAVGRPALDRQFVGVHGYSYAADAKAARWLRARTSPRQTVEVFAFEPLVNFLARRPAPTRFVANHALLDKTWSYGREAWMREFVAGIERTPPAYFVTVARPRQVGDPRPLEASPAPQVRAFVERRYLYEARIERFKFYRRATRTAASPGRG